MTDTMPRAYDPWKRAKRHPRNASPDRRKTSVYRLLAADDRLLYVGVSVDPFPRLDQHWKKKAWWSEVDRVRIEWFACRQDALDEELRAIRTESPIHNVQGCGGPGQCRATPERPEPISAAEDFYWIGDD